MKKSLQMIVVQIAVIRVLLLFAKVKLSYSIVFYSPLDIATPEFNNSTQLHYLEDESFVSNAPVDDTNQSVESVESLLFAEHHVIANEIDEPNDTSTTSDDAETSIGIGN